MKPRWTPLDDDVRELQFSRVVMVLNTLRNETCAAVHCFHACGIAPTLASPNVHLCESRLDPS